jgi:hypothetical protein
MHRVQQRWDKVRGELQRVVSEGNAADFMGGGVHGAAATRGTGIGGALARSGQRQLDALSHGARSEGARLFESNWVGTVALGRAQFGAQCCFAIIHTLL